MSKTEILTLACIGCGARAQTYCRLAARQPDRYRLVAGADPVAERVEKIRSLSGAEGFRGFSGGDELLARERLADILLIATQDNDHYDFCRRALDLGYHVLLEKPIAVRPEQVLDIERRALERNRRVMVCFVLRFAAFYRKVKEILDSGELGEIVSVQAGEGVMPWHQAHSFVRGHWSVAASSSPMILSKCCHDTDILHWLIGRPCRKAASFGSLDYFRPERAPAGAPPRCTDGCPAEKECAYSALRYAGDRRFPWLPMVYDRAADASPEEIRDWLRGSPWGRCVYRCGNDVVDRQVLALEFEGGVTAGFTMTAFDTGRHLEIQGTRGVLKGGDLFYRQFGAHLLLLPHEGEARRFTVRSEDGGYELHGGGDPALVRALYDEMTLPEGEPLQAAISSTVHSHLIAFAAEEARVSGRVVDVAQFQRAAAALSRE